MTAIKVQAVVEADGELHLRDLPYRKGDRVEAVLLLDEVHPEDEKKRARQRLLDHSKAFTFRSAGPYPSRDELRERT
jgi:hypothetical protein